MTSLLLALVLALSPSTGPMVDGVQVRHSAVDHSFKEKPTHIRPYFKDHR